MCSIFAYKGGQYFSCELKCLYCAKIIQYTGCKIIDAPLMLIIVVL